MGIDAGIGRFAATGEEKPLQFLARRDTHMPWYFKNWTSVTFLSCSVGLLFWSPAAVGASCVSSGQRPYVDFNVESGQARYITDKSKNELIFVRRANGQTASGWSPIGYTRIQFGWNIGVQVHSSREFEEDWYCSEVTSIKASFEYDSIDVYIASEYPRGTCQYNSILDHERRHVGIFHDTLDEFAPRIEHVLYDALEKMKPERVNNPDRFLERQKDKLEQMIKPLIKELGRVGERRNAALDTLENYRREQEDCLSW